MHHDSALRQELRLRPRVDSRPGIRGRADRGRAAAAVLARGEMMPGLIRWVIEIPWPETIIR